MNAAPIRLLILGAGNMANNHAQAFTADPRVEVAAAVDIEAERLAEFSRHHAIPDRFPDLKTALAWGEFDAAVNVTPDPVHHATTMQLAAAGKHVLCEKPLAMSHSDAMEMTDAMESRGLVNLVNLTYRGVPEIAEAAKLVAEGAIGRVRHITADYLQSWLVGNYWGDWRTESRWLWRLSTEHGSTGALGDVGVHILDAALFVAGLDATEISCRLKTFPKAPGDRIGPYPLDANDSFIISLALEQDALAMVQSTRSAPGYANTIRIEAFGDAGGLRVDYRGQTSSLEICVGEDVHDQTWRAVDCPSVPPVVRRFVDALTSGSIQEPTFRRAAKIQKLLDSAIVSDREGRTISV